MALDLGTLFVKLGLDTGGFETSILKAQANMTKVSAAMEKASDNAKNAGKALSAAGATISKAVTLPMAAMAAVTTRAAINFETAFTGVRKTVDATESQFREMEQAVKDMSRRLPASTTEIAAVAEAAGQLGVKREAIMGFTETMIKLGMTTNLTSDQAATAFARIGNIMQVAQDDFGRMGATVVALGNAGASTESEIVDMAMRLAGAGKVVGISTAQVLGFSNALSSVGIEAEAGGTAISKVMIDITNEVKSSGKNLELYAAVAGQTADQFKTAFETDAAGAIVTFIEGLGKMQASGQNVFPVLDSLGLSEVRVRDALLRASGAGDLFRQSLDLGSKAWAENTALNEEAAKRNATMASQLKLMKDRLDLVAVSIGTGLVPTLQSMVRLFEPLLKRLEDAGTRFAALDKATQDNIVKWGLIVAAIGPVIAIAGKLVTVAGTVIAVGSKLVFAFKAVALGAATIGEALTFALGPVGLTVLAIGGLIAAGYLLVKNWKTIRDTTLNIWGEIKTAVLIGAAAMTDAYAKFIGIFSEAKAQEARATANSLRKQAQAELGLVEYRKDGYDQDVAAHNDAELIKAAKAQRGAKIQQDASSETTQKAQANAQAQADAAIAAQQAAIDASKGAEEAKQAYLDEFETAFSRSQDELTTKFSRAQEDQTTLFRQAQDDQLAQKKASLDKQMSDYQGHLDGLSTKFAIQQDDEKIKFENGLRDRRDAKKAELDKEYSDYKDALDREYDALQISFDKAAALRNSELAGKLDPIKARIAAIQLAQDEEDQARKVADMTERVAEAQADLNDARKKGDPKDIADAEKRLTAILRDQADMTLRDARRAEINQLQLKIKGFEDSKELADKAAEKQLRADQENMRTRNEGLLRDKQTRLDIEMKGFEDILAQDAVNFKRRQDAEATQFKKALDALAQQNKDLLGEELRKFQLSQAQAETEWKRSQEDQATRYKTELEDLKTSLTGKLAEQATFVANWNAMAGKMAALAPAVQQAGSAPATLPVPAAVVAPGAVTPVAPTPPAVPLTPAEKSDALAEAQTQAKSGNLDQASETLSDAWGMSKEQAKENLAPLVGSSPIAQASPSEQAAAESNLSALDKAKQMIGAGDIEAAAKALSDAYGLSLEQARANIIANLPQNAAGGVAFGPTVGVFGEAGTEALTPLSWLADRMQAFAETIVSAMGKQALAPLARLDDAFGGFNARVNQAVMGTFGGGGGMSEGGQLAVAGMGGLPSVNVYIGERQVYDIVVAANEDATRRGRR